MHRPLQDDNDTTRYNDTSIASSTSGQDKSDQLASTTTDDTSSLTKSASNPVTPSKEDLEKITNSTEMNADEKLNEIIALLKTSGAAGKE